MKNLSLRFTLVALALVLVGGVIRNTGTPAGLAVLLSPLGMVTMLLSLKLHRPVAHGLNMMAATLWLALPVTYLFGKDAGDVSVMVSFAFAPLVLVCIASLWALAWSLRGQDEMEMVELCIPGRRSDLVLPQPSSMSGTGRKNSINPPQR